MVNVDAVDGATRLFGQTTGSRSASRPPAQPDCCTPAGPDAAHAARVANIPFIIPAPRPSTMEELAEITPDLGWYQLYMPRDRAIGDWT